MSQSAWDAFHLAASVKTPFEESGKSKESKAKQEKQVMYLTADDFGNSIGGRKNIVRFIQAMRCDFNALYFELVVDGMVQLKDTHAKGFSPACWEELLSRIPGYFSQKYKGKGADGKTHPVCKNSWFMIHDSSLFTRLKSFMMKIESSYITLPFFEIDSLKTFEDHVLIPLEIEDLFFKDIDFMIFDDTCILLMLRLKASRLELPVESC